MSTPSLAARVHGFLAAKGDTRHWSGAMKEAEHKALFGTDLRSAIALTIYRNDKGAIDVTYHTYERTYVSSLADIQHESERSDDDDDRLHLEDHAELYVGYGCDYYRSFPRNESSFAVIRNPVTGFQYELIACDLGDVGDLMARHHGYADWAEMRSYALPGDKEEDWVVSWVTGSPEENRQSAIASLEAERVELGKTLLDSKVQDLGRQFRDRQAGLFDFGLPHRDPEAFASLTAECEELRRLQKEAVAESDVAFERWKEVVWLLEMYRDPDRQAA